MHMGLARLAEAPRWRLPSRFSKVDAVGTTVGIDEYLEVLGGTLSRVDQPELPPIEITGEPLVVGRAPECGLVLDDPKVSSTHAELVATGNGVRLRDLGSRNGTFVDSVRCTEVHLLAQSRLRFGAQRFLFTPRTVRVETGSAEPFGPLVGSSAVMKRLFHRIKKIASTDLSTLILGETGTGKELVANAIHLESARAARPFVVVDCSAIPASIAESTLFGHEKGSFTGATERRVSPFVDAEGGTVFLDEIGELPIDLQPKLLRLLQERKVKSVGSNTYRTVNVRVIAATRRELQKEINGGAFRSDLYFRLAQVVLELPPLRERAEDIPFLIDHFARDVRMEEAARRITPESLVRLMKHDWPGNVRELQNLIVAALALAEPHGPIDLEGSFSSSGKAATSARQTQPWDVARGAFEKAYWGELQRVCEGNIAMMSRVSGKSRPTVRETLERNGLGKYEVAEDE
jgi:DNA-binding NtrC family response regulator